MTFRILVTGSRSWTDRDKLQTAIVETARGAGAHPQETVIVHGAARGADSIAEEIGRRFGCQIEAYPADWERYGKSAGHRRNAEMVAAGADICLGFPLGESRGTRSCMRVAEAAGIRVINHGDRLDRNTHLAALVEQAAQLGLYEATAEPKRTR